VTDLAQRPILAQGTGAAVRAECGHHACVRSERRGGGRLTVWSSPKARAWSGVVLGKVEDGGAHLNGVTPVKRWWRCSGGFG
jgi:hypothetical protein